MARDRPTVAVVGAGLAGLTCADRLTPHVDVVLLEARDRVGGRCWSSRGWLDGQVAEHGGELIEAGQDHVLGLVRSLGLGLEDRQPSAPAPGARLVGGGRLPLDSVAGLGAFVGLLGEEMGSLSGVTAATADDLARALDEMSVADWLAERVDGGLSSTLGRAVVTMVRLNLGFDPQALSALSLHHMFLGFTDDPGLDAGFAFGNDVAERGVRTGHDLTYADAVRSALTHTMHVRGGNDLIAQGLAERLPASVLRLGTAVVAVRRARDGRYEVLAADGERVEADRVVLANPLPTLRRVDLTSSGLSRRRHDAIDSMGMGTNTKIMVQMRARPADLDGWPGFAIHEEPPFAVWDSSVGQDGASGIVTFFGQGDLPASVPGGHGPPPPPVQDQAGQILAMIGDGLPGHVGDGAWADVWQDDPWAGGSYAGYAPGQYTRFSGFLATPEGAIHFAGEHTSLSSPGYLDGAVASGQRAADEVLVSLGLARQ